MREILPIDNADPYIIVKESEFNPERHLLPTTLEKIDSGSMVGLLPSDSEHGEHVCPVETMDDFWIYYRWGIVREDYRPTELDQPVKVYIAVENSESQTGDMIYVKLKPGLYVDFSELAYTIRSFVIRNFFREEVS